MTYFFDVLELADYISRVSDVFRKEGSGRYRMVLCCQETGEIRGLCSHEHDSKEEAWECSEAQTNKERIERDTKEVKLDF